MGRRGPPKIPTTLKLLRGCPSGVRKLPRGEPKPPLVTDNTAPEFLSPAAQSIWTELVPKLETLGLFTVLDRNAVGRYCELSARWLIASKRIAETGKTHVPVFHEQTDEDRAAGTPPRLKYIQELPESLEMRRLPGELLRLEQQFGMTPAARASISILPPTAGKPNDLDDFLFGSRRSQ